MARREMFSKYLVTKQRPLEAGSSIILELLFVKAAAKETKTDPKNFIIQFRKGCIFSRVTESETNRATFECSGMNSQPERK